MMNTSQKLIALLSGAALLSVSSLAAQTATTAPVGYVSVDVNANADLKRGVPFSQAASFAAAADSVLAGTVTVQSTVPDLTTESHFLSVTSGTLIGKWYEVTGSTASSVTVAEDLQAAGLAASDTFTVVPFWTLDGLFPNGGDIPQSSDVFSPVAFILVNDVTQLGTNLAAGSLYFYHDGTQGPAGWYDNDNLGGGTIDAFELPLASALIVRRAVGTDELISWSPTIPYSL